MEQEQAKLLENLKVLCNRSIDVYEDGQGLGFQGIYSPRLTSNPQNGTTVLEEGAAWNSKPVWGASLLMMNHYFVENDVASVAGF